ncbi:hypothetical protein CM240_2876 [Clostridium bornimense]|uniref:DUF1801 domain-containing protein n=1 Tax=Clostridium bornimense TaxID=1216932 RepID=W6RZV6_9CLOT|nr:hypothetical protein [Clostridium bornimense]CDM69993.1 hypothetical protein CM240_2876 [Clostridium bornimense]
MNEDIQSYINKYSNEIIQLFTDLRKLVVDSVSQTVDEKLWAKLPSYYIEDRFIRIIPFKDHINVEAKAVVQYRAELKEFKITPKGMLQIYINQNIPKDILTLIFKETLLG